MLQFLQRCQQIGHRSAPAVQPPNQHDVDFTPARCFHELFEAQIDRTPEAVAVACGGQQVSYLELNRLANELAKAKP